MARKAKGKPVRIRVSARPMPKRAHEEESRKKSRRHEKK
jgi:hypothetical protein